MSDERLSREEHASSEASTPAKGLWLTWIGAALPLIILPVVIVTIPVAAGESTRLTSDELTS